MTTEKEVTLNAHNKAEYPPMHTCEHILNQTMVRMFGCERSRNAHIERKKSKINYDLADEPTEEQIAEIARKVNEVIAADLPVTYAYVSRDAVPDNVPLDKLPDAAEDTLRYCQKFILNRCFHKRTCIGAHVEHTAQIGRFHINSTSYKDGQFRIVFKLLDTVWE